MLRGGPYGPTVHFSHFLHFLLGDFLSINNEQAPVFEQAPTAEPGSTLAAGTGNTVATGNGDASGIQIYRFTGGAASWFGTQILGLLITVCTLGICYPFAVVLVERWRAKNTYLQGRQLAFVGTGWGIFGLWMKWLLLCIITVGIYSFWMYPRLVQWKVEKTVYA